MEIMERELEKKSIHNERWINKLEGEKPGPSLVFFAAVHGNEPAGVIALQEVLGELERNEAPFKGNIYGIVGNLPALKVGKRYLDEDLNRLWSKARVDQIHKKPNLLVEEEELLELLDIINEIIREAKGPLYFIDLHTTSSKTYPFITINDALINRKFAMEYPVPMVLGIEEYLTGPMLSFINQSGYVAVGFEAGQHDDPRSILCAKAFIRMTLVLSGVMKKKEVNGYKEAYQFLDDEAGYLHKVFEIVHLHHIGKWDQFKMKPGYDSFQIINKGEVLAIQNGEPITAPYRGRIFMPLYQSQGSDGFFIIHRIPTRILGFSALLRKVQIDRLLPFLPGVSWEDESKSILRVDLRTAKYLAKPFFHLLGYRVRVKEGKYLLLNNRERASRDKLYQKTKWW